MKKNPINTGVDELVEKTNSIFKLVILAARRAYELSQGSEKLVEAELNTKPTIVALQEIIENKITYKARLKDKNK